MSLLAFAFLMFCHFLGFSIVGGLKIFVNKIHLDALINDRFLLFYTPSQFLLTTVHSYVLFYIVCTFYIKIRFTVINELLLMKFQDGADEKITTKWSQKNFQNILNSYSQTYILKLLSIMHIQLIDTIKLVNGVFTLPIALFMALNLCGFTFSLYETYDLLKSSTKHVHHIGYTITISFFHIHYFIYNFVAIFVSTLVARERDMTHEILQRIFNGNFDANTRRQLRLFMMQTKHSRVDFSCGIFNYDWILLHSVRSYLLSS